MKQVLALVLVGLLLATVGCAGKKAAEATPTPAAGEELAPTPTPAPPAAAEGTDGAPALEEEVIPEVSLGDDGAEDVDFGSVI